MIDTHLADPDTPLRVQAHPCAGDAMVRGRLVAAAAPSPKRGAPYAGRDELSAAVDGLRRRLAALARSPHADTRRAAAELTADVVESLAGATERAGALRPRTVAQLDPKLARDLAAAYGRRGLTPPGASAPG